MSEHRLTRKPVVAVQTRRETTSNTEMWRPPRIPSETPLAHRASHQPDSVKLSILMPAYNEERTILEAVHDILAVDYPCNIELIVIDDGSTDGTSSLLKRISDERVVVMRHITNRGKGAALRSALSVATGTYVLPFDADLEYAPEDIPKMLKPILKGRCQVVYGARLFGCNTVYQSYRYAVGNRFLTRAANILFDASLTDLHTCLKLMPMAFMKTFQLSQNGFGMDTEVTAMLLRCGIRPFEVPVSYYSRSRAQGKKITWRDAVACMRILLHVRLRGSSEALPVAAIHYSHQYASASCSAESEPNQSAPAILLNESLDGFAGATFQHINSLREPASQASGRAAGYEEPKYLTDNPAP